MLVRIVSIFLAAVIAPGTAVACVDEKIGCGPFTDWYDANWLEMSMRDGQGRGNARWVISIDKENNDIVIEIDEHYDGKVTKGTLMIIAGRMMLAKGLKLKEGYEIDAADGPGLMMQLLLNLLGHIAPDGPQSMKEKVTVNHTEKERPIRVSTASASGVFGVPWSAVGTLEKQQDNIVRYDINFASTVSEENEYSVEMSGKWEAKKLEPLTDNMSLEGWRIYTIGPYTKEYDSGTIFDYGARITQSNAVTIGALRKEIESAQAAPNRAPQPAQ